MCRRISSRMAWLLMVLAAPLMAQQVPAGQVVHDLGRMAQAASRHFGSDARPSLPGSIPGPGSAVRSPGSAARVEREETP
jgi:hypothetical protein